MLKKLKQLLSEKGEINLKIKINPTKPRTEIKQVMADGTIKIDIAALAQKGRANRELIRYLAEEFGVSKGNIKIISGTGQRLKLVKIVK